MISSFGKFAVAALLVAGATPAGAAPAQWGMSLENAQLAYPAARKIAAADRAGGAVLELAGYDYAWTHWQSVDFIFDGRGGLERVQLVVRGESVEQVKARLTQQWDREEQSAVGERSVLGFSTSMQVRICDHGAAGVYLTYERPSREI